jgi:hypothetical protein
MKTAILVLVSEDKKQGQPLTGVLPYDEAVAEYKALCEANVSPIAEFPVLQIWVPAAKSRRLKGGPVTIVSAASVPAGPVEGELVPSSLDGSPSAASPGDASPSDASQEETDSPETSDTSSASHGEASPGSMSPKGKRGK